MSDMENGLAHDGTPIDAVVTSRGYTRRDALKAGAGLGAFLALGPTVLAACGDESGTSGSPSPTSTGPKKGGEIRFGYVGLSPKDTLDGQYAPATADEVYASQLYERLIYYAPNQTDIVYELAESLEPNSDGTEWTARLKSGLEFHNAKTVTADDVVFSFNRLIDPKLDMPMASAFTTLKTVRKIDDLTVRFELSEPSAWFTDALAQWRAVVVPKGFDPSTPAGAIGTGAWKIESFTPGEGGVLVPHANYWGEGPYTDKLTIVGYKDPVALTNALLGGTVDYIVPVSGTQEKLIEDVDGYAVLTANTGAFTNFAMDMTMKPFDDNRVREAFKLIAGRPEMIEQAMGGTGGWLGNDMPSPFDPGYPKDVPQREQDLEKARSLLKQAGYDNDLTVELNTAEDMGAGAVEATQVFAEQCKGAGVTAKVIKLPAGEMYGDEYQTRPWAQEEWSTHIYFSQVIQSHTPTAPYNTTKWKNDEWWALVSEAMRTLDDTKRNEMVGEAMKIQWENDGMLIWSFHNVKDGYSTKLGGLIENNFAKSATWFNFKSMYFV